MLTLTTSHWLPCIVLLLVLTGICGCGGGSDKLVAAPTPKPTVSLSVTPNTVTSLFKHTDPLPVVTLTWNSTNALRVVSCNFPAQGKVSGSTPATVPCGVAPTISKHVYTITVENNAGRATASATVLVRQGAVWWGYD